MPRGMVTAVVHASSAEVFALLHDYARRLEWDTLLSEAYLVPRDSVAAVGSVAVCRGRRRLGGFALRTRYVTFRAPDVAAIKLVAPAPFFQAFAASIRHVDLGPHSSRMEYRYYFSARPKFLRWLLEPVMNCVLRWETKRRLAALERFFEP